MVELLSSVTYEPALFLEIIRQGMHGKPGQNRHRLTLVLIVATASTSWSQTPFASACAEDDHISAAKRASVNSAAQKFAQALLGSEPATAYDLLSDGGKQDLTREQLATQMSSAVKQFEPKNIRIQHTYVVTLKGKSPGRLICSTDLSKPTGWESVAATDVAEQAHVLLAADARNNQLVFTLWLVPERETWKIQSFWVNVATLADKGSEQLWELGHAEKQKGHFFNAALLYAAAAQACNRGPNFQLGLAQAITDEVSHLSVPAEIQGQPPFTWKAADVTFSVLNVGPIAVGGMIYVMIQHEASPWTNDSQAEALNRKLLAYFKSRFPEYSDVFAGIVARVHERGGNRGYGTVEELSSTAKQ